MWSRNRKTCVLGVGVRGQPEGAGWRLGCENPGNVTKSLNVFFFFNLFLNWSIIAFQCCIRSCCMAL